MTKLIASMTINVAYNEETPIAIRRFPTEFEIQVLNSYPHKLIDDEQSVSDNEIVIKMYKKHSNSISKLISGGNYDFNDIIPPSLYIDIKTKYSDSNLNRNISKITKQLCKEHLKPCTLFPSRHTTSCRIPECNISDKILEQFLSDFCRELETKISAKEFASTEKLIEYDDIEICDRCQIEVPKNEIKHLSMATDGKVQLYCPSCYDVVQTILKNDNVLNGAENSVSMDNSNINSEIRNKISNLKMDKTRLAILLTTVVIISVYLVTSFLI